VARCTQHAANDSEDGLSVKQRKLKAQREREQQNPKLF
jgi:hypothetical protein